MVGCVSGEHAKKQPPRPIILQMNNITDEGQLKDMFDKSKETKDKCAESGSNSLMALIPFLQGQSGYSGPMPPISGNCTDSLINFIMMYTSMKNGRYANEPETRPWFIAQLGDIVTQVVERLQSRGLIITPDVQQKLYQAGWGLVKRDIVSQPQLQVVRPAVCSEAQQLGLEC